MASAIDFSRVNPHNMPVPVGDPTFARSYEEELATAGQPAMLQPHRAAPRRIMTDAVNPAGPPMPPSAAAAAPSAPTVIEVTHPPGKPAAPRAAGGAKPAPTAPAAKPAAPMAFEEYKSQRPRSMYDDAIRVEQFSERVAGMLGLSDDAQKHRAAYFDMTMRRNGELANEGIRRLVAGDIKAAIDVYNHAAPTGRQIVAFARGPNNTLRFRYDDGKEVDGTMEAMVEDLSALANPAIFAQLMTIRASKTAEGRSALTKAQFDLQGNLIRDQFQHRQNLERDAARIAQEAANRPEQVTMDPMGGAAIVTSPRGTERLDRTTGVRTPLPPAPQGLQPGAAGFANTAPAAPPGAPAGRSPFFFSDPSQW